jgi:hypothetical protein
MRWFYLAVIVLLAVATLVFALQKLRNRDRVVPRLQAPRAARASDDCRLRPRRGDGRKPPGATAKILRRVKAEHYARFVRERLRVKGCPWAASTLRA